MPFLKVKIIVFAYSQMGYECLKYLLQNNFNVVAVFTHEDAHNQEYVWFESVAKLALAKNIPTFTVNPNNNLELVKSFKPQLFLSFYFRHLLSAELLKIPNYGAFNMHGSLLPKYRGRCPVNWAIIHGEIITGVTLHRMVEKADAGKIIGQKNVSITLEDNAGTVSTKINKKAVKLLSENVKNLCLGCANEKENNLVNGSYYGGRTEKDSQIDWSKSALDIHNLIRALQPYPNYPSAFSYDQDEEKVYFMHSSILNSLIEFDKIIIGKELLSKSGQVIAIQEEKFIVKCGDNNYLIINYAFTKKNSNILSPLQRFTPSLDTFFVNKI